MLAPKQLLSQSNLNNAFLSKTTTNAQGVNSTLQISGGQMQLKVSYLSDNLNSSFLQINPQGAQVIIYDGVNNQKLSVYSKSGSETTYITTLNGSPSYGLIDTTVDHLEINTSSKKPLYVGGTVQINVASTGNANSGAMILGSQATWTSSVSANGIIGFVGNGMQHAQIAWYPSNGMYFIDSSSSSPAGLYPTSQARVPVYVGKLYTAKNTVDDGNGNASTTGALTVGTNIFMTGTINNTAVNAGIEHGSITTANTPYIDFHSSGYNNDYDARIIAQGGTSGNTQTGDLTVHSKHFYVDAVLNLANYSGNARLVLPVGANMYATV